jgi:hypothetical protein
MLVRATSSRSHLNALADDITEVWKSEETIFY